MEQSRRYEAIVFVKVYNHARIHGVVMKIGVKEHLANIDGTAERDDCQRRGRDASHHFAGTRHFSAEC